VRCLRLYFRFRSGVPESGVTTTFQRSWSFGLGFPLSVRND
jgi:hypothetical protein